MYHSGRVGTSSVVAVTVHKCREAVIRVSYKANIATQTDVWAKSFRPSIAPKTYLALPLIKDYIYVAQRAQLVFGCISLVKISS